MGQITSAPPRPVSPIHPTQQKFQPKPDTWVQLRNLPSTYSYDRAILICELDQDAWIAWIPDHGEILLQRSQFHSE